MIKPDISPALAVISGGFGDIGQAIARLFGEAGAAVALADLPERSAAGELPLDVTDAAAVERWFDAVTARFGQLPNQIIVNAATATFRGALEITPEEWQREINVNLNGAFHFARAGVARLVKAGKPGRVVFIGSWAAEAPHVAIPAYSVSKAGMRMLCRTLALELAPHGIRVNEVAPGYVNAGLSGRVFAAQPKVAERARATTPIRELIEPEAVAQQVLYLCSAYAGAITGSVLLQDGGLSLLQGPKS